MKVRNSLLIVAIIALSGCGAFPTPSIKMNAGVITDGLKELQAQDVKNELIKELVLCAEINEEVIGAPSVRIDIDDLPAIKKNRESAKGTLTTGSNVWAWTLGLGGIVAGALGSGGIQRFLNKAAARHRGDPNAA